MKRLFQLQTGLCSQDSAFPIPTSQGFLRVHCASLSQTTFSLLLPSLMFISILPRFISFLIKSTVQLHLEFVLLFKYSISYQIRNTIELLLLLRNAYIKNVFQWCLLEENWKVCQAWFLCLIILECSQNAKRLPKRG